MHNSESFLVNEIHKFLRGSNIQTVYLISSRRPDLVIINKRERERERAGRIVEFSVPVDHKVKIKENEKRDELLNLAKELKKVLEHEGDGDTGCN